MSNKYFLFFLLVCSFLNINANAQTEKTGTEVSCEEYKTTPEKPVKCWLEFLRKDPSPGTRKWVAENLAKLGPKAEEAVPVLAKMINDKDGEVRRKVFEALTKIAETCDECPAAKVLIDILAKDYDPFSPRVYALEGLAKIYNTRRLVGTNPLSGWVGVYKPGDFRLYQWDKPVVSADGKSYSQSASKGAIGNAVSYSVTETLARDSDFAQKYSDEKLKKEHNPPLITYVGKRKVLIWNLGKKNDLGGCSAPKSRVVVMLSVDKVWISESCFRSFYEKYKKQRPKTDVIKFPDEQLAFFDRAEVALENPPRTDFRRTVELFKPLKKEMSPLEVQEYIGLADDTYLLGEGIAVAIYNLLDESKVILRYSNPVKTIKSFSENSLWKLQYAVVQNKAMNQSGELIK